MKKLYLLATAIASFAAPAAAQEWPEDMARPATYPWEALWPLNNSDDVTKILLGRSYLAQSRNYYDFATERHPSGMADNYSVNVRFRADLPGGNIVSRISVMNIGDTEAFTGTGISGQVKLVGTEPLGPHTCRQVEWTMRKTSNVIVGNKAGYVSKLELYCFDPAKKSWFPVKNATSTAG
ncbi:hypothetical protein IC614_04080 [Allosphingosinicella flava]|uniref:Uncharacterized protein n=1 Tax=Allosphingosinicella flava TaxID=2771430 RepID=A0A7T2GKZ1_9SPHN|nr:hypothetical protein [Sphingosinicella flava]QPQ55776.1 hypothetical protein IC614_04080 [Sphingosinicella flava]